MLTQGLLALVAMLGANDGPTTKERALPKEFEGVWTVSKISVDGKLSDIERDIDDHAFPSPEIVICRNRIVMIQTNGESMPCTVRVLTEKPEVKIEARAGVCHDKEGQTSYALIRRAGDDLILAWVPEDAKKINGEKGAGQVVYTAQAQK